LLNYEYSSSSYHQSLILPLILLAVFTNLWPRIIISSVHHRLHQSEDCCSGPGCYWWLKLRLTSANIVHVVTAAVGSNWSCIQHTCATWSVMFSCVSTVKAWSDTAIENGPQMRAVLTQLCTPWPAADVFSIQMICLFLGLVWASFCLSIV